MVTRIEPATNLFNTVIGVILDMKSVETWSAILLGFMWAGVVAIVE